MNYYSHHIGDYTADAAHLSMLEDGAYRRLLDRYYTTEAPLPYDWRAVCRLVRAHTTEECDAVVAVLSEFFDLADDGWHHKRCDAEILAYKAKAEANRVNGVKGGRPRKTEQEPTENPQKTQVVSENNPQKTLTNNQEPRTNNQEPLFKTNTPAAPDIGAEEFELAWMSYPRRPGASKADSWKAWKARIKAGASASEMLAGVERYSSFVRANGTEPQFIKQPQTFFGPGEHYKADWSVSPRASPARYESEKDRSRRETYEALTGRKAHDQRHDIIDI